MMTGRAAEARAEEKGRYWVVNGGSDDGGSDDHIGIPRAQ
jgi:hypothetical protein